MLTDRGVDLKNRYIELKDRWLDRKGSTETMFISESPPPEVKSYFYDLEGESSLRNDLFEAVGVGSGKEPEEELEAFLKRYWLTHLFYEPIREVDVEEIPDHIEELKREAERIQPDKIKLILPAYDSDSMIDLLTEKLRIVLGCEDISAMTLLEYELSHQEKLEKLVELIDEDEG